MSRDTRSKFMRSFISMTSIFQPLIFFEQIWILLLQLQITIPHLIISLWKFICSNLSSYKLRLCNQFACSIWFGTVWVCIEEFVLRILKLVSIEIAFTETAAFKTFPCPCVHCLDAYSLFYFVLEVWTQWFPVHCLFESRNSTPPKWNCLT